MAQDGSKVKRSSQTFCSCGGTHNGLPRQLYVLECLAQPGQTGEVPREGLVGCWREPPFVYCFYDRQVTDLVEADLAVKGFHVTGRYEMSSAQWQPRPGPWTTVGPFCIVCPCHKKDVPLTHALPIALHLGLVFGSGVHPTTQLCLKLLAQVFDPESMKTVVDLGTGTGILALAAARLGAQQVLALDVNPLAVQEAAANIFENDLEHVVFPAAAEGLYAVGRFGQLLLINLEWPSLCAVLQTDDWKHFPWVLCSGYLEAQADTLHRMLAQTHDLRSQTTEKDWVASFWIRLSSSRENMAPHSPEP
ncbi:50S ribosomal protein L11 methyltransferase [Desulfosoma sp.]|uniref:50S ribosomal protein L11 methyltransferase n=1 Tax=Desulfosoma sp. TaxID=2603217 RepID=UPI004049CF95